MQLNEEKLAHSRYRYTAQLTELEVAEYYEEAVRRLAPTVKIAGFRPGKAPMNLVRDQLKQQAIREEAYSLAVSSAWQKIVTGLKQLPIQDPEVEVGDFTKGQATKIVFEFDVRPEITLEKAEAISLPATPKPEVTEAEIDEVIETLREPNAKTLVKLTPAEIGDRLEINFQGKLLGKVLPKLSAEKFPLQLGKSSVIPGFEEQLVGIKKGESKTFSLTFPRDHFDQELKGKAVEFTVTVAEVYQVLLPELNEEFAQKFQKKTLEELRQAIEDDLQIQKADEQFVQQKAQWLAEFEKRVKGELPESLLKAEIDRSEQSWRSFLNERHLEADEWLSNQKLTHDKLQADWRKAAESSVRIGLGLAELAQKEDRHLHDNEDFQRFLDERVRLTISSKKQEKSS